MNKAEQYAEINKYNAKQKELEEQRKAYEKKARLEREALIKKQLDAKAEEDAAEINRMVRELKKHKVTLPAIGLGNL